ncbi:DUF421 domain-containing protein [Bacillus sp. 2205SS5-2]|uniref:DUF421 domain-containing protein n=1 Tax=Bacillus sp. 2205SS5-2 TaxID=3109031 RepID=UPI003006AD47
MPGYIEVALRSIFIIIGLFGITKLLGKKQLSKLSFFEYITGITVGDIAGTISMEKQLDLLEGLTSLIIWSLFPLLISIIGLHSPIFRHFVEGTPTVFIEDGKIKEKALRKEKYTTDELLEQLRKKNIFRVDDVAFASLDTNGDLSIMVKREKQPLLYEDLFQLKEVPSPPQAVINDGRVDQEALKKVGYSVSWLEEEIAKRSLTVKDIFLAQLDKNGKLSFDLYDWSDK